MISVDRNTVPSPLSPDLVAFVEDWVREIYARSPSRRSKQRRDLKERQAITRQAYPALMRLFKGKCAYCESEIGAASVGEVDQFRPFADASNLSGEGSSDHYAWLVAEWQNLYLACPSCSRSKRSLFPVAGERAKPMAPIDLVRATEDAQLVDPCFDLPEEHLEFLADGLVQPKSPKGEVTIKVCSLNRAGLVQARRDAWERVTRRFTSFLTDDELERLTSDGVPYAAVARAAVTSMRDQRSGPHPIRLIRRVTTERRSAEQILATDEEAFRLNARPMRRVEIVNFRALRNVVIEFGEPRSERAPWLMLLGENATGKTTALQAIALALAGATEARYHTRPSRLLSAGAYRGSVTIWFWDQDAPVELHFSRGASTFEGTRGPSAIVLGYGALRYAERRGGDGVSPRFSRIWPLLQPIARIRYPGRWLSDLDSKRFDTAARALQSILPISEDSVMFRDSKGIHFDLGEHVASLSELSSGYQTVVGMCADIMRPLFERWDTLSSATAIVFVDELDAHLHPQWTMRIVGALRGAFPQVQFVASTHNPLALRGLRNGEVALLRRDEDGAVVVDQDLPPIEGMQVDELLTSRVFGLDSTMDPETGALLTEYYQLRSLPRSAESEGRMREIRARVGDRGVLGLNARERLMLAAAGEYIEEADNDPELRSPLSREAIRRLREIAGLRVDPEGDE